MKSLSVKNPWASLIAVGLKTLEIRSWATRYRGELLICAGGRPSRTPDAERAAPMLADGPMPDGHAVCVVELVDCRPMDRQDAEAACCSYDEGAFAWVLAHVRRVAPFPVKGQLSFFEVHDALIHGEQPPHHMCMSCGLPVSDRVHGGFGPFGVGDG